MARDFSQGKIWKNILAQALPLTVAQLVQLLYNIVDRIYLGRLPGTDSLALAGVGLTFPVVTLIAAFTALFGNGGTPIFSIARGAGDEDKARRVLGDVTVMLFGTSIVLMVFCFLFRRPILYLFGASDASIVYADAYLTIYLAGTVFSVMTTGLNGFINAQGFPKIGMMTTVFGAALNLILDPIFIFGLHMGVRGAALATVISQFCSFIWVFRFFRGSSTAYRIERSMLKADLKLTLEIMSLGASGFIVQATNCLVQVACNSTLQTYGGDLYVSVMTVCNSVREISSLAVTGIAHGGQPVLGYNYGAGKPKRVKEAIRFQALLGFSYTLVIWIVILLVPGFFVSIFTKDASLLAAGPSALKIYFFGFVFMSFQFVGQSTFQALGYAKRAICFSLLRKVIIVTPLTLLLPMLGLGVDGVFWAEPISNVIGGTACFVTMYLTVYRHLGKKCNS